MAGGKDGAERASLENSKLNHSEYILGKISDLWESKLLTDVSLKVQGKVLKAPICHLVWHFCKASDSRKIERLQERACVLFLGIILATLSF